MACPTCLLDIWCRNPITFGAGTRLHLVREPDYNFGSDRRCLTCVKRSTRKAELWPPSRLTDSLAVEGVGRCVTNLSNMSDAWRKRIAAHCWVTLEGRRLSLLIGADNVALTVLLYRPAQCTWIPSGGR